MLIFSSAIVRMGVGFTCFAMIVSCSALGENESSAPPEARVSFSFGLERDQDGLAEFVTEVNDPDQARYRQFLSMSQSADRFGVDPDTAESVMSVLNQAGFDGDIEASGGLAVGSFSVSDAERFFGVAFDTTTTSSDLEKIVPRSQIQVPEALAENVTDVFGGEATLRQSSPVRSSGSGNSSPDDEPPCPVSAGSGPALSSTLGPLYGLTSLRNAGLTGKDVRVGLLEIDTFSKRALNLTAKCYGRKRQKVNLVSSNATKEQLNPTNQESSLDLVALGLAAPSLSDVTVIQFDGRSSIVFPLATVMDLQVKRSEALNILTISVSFCATSLTQDEEKMSEWLLMSAAATGLTVLASSGDTGSTGCYPSSQSLDLQYPAASPYTTSIGGTQLDDGSSGVIGQSVWNEGPQGDFAGGGGPNSRISRPEYQSVTGLQESVLQTPDVAFLASPRDVGPIAVCDPDVSCEFRTLAGTSATAPGVAGALALIIESFAVAGQNSQLGFLNRTIYRLASDDKTKDVFIDITKGNNDLFDVGCCTATDGYDMASGWGSIRFNRFAEEVAELTGN